MRSLIKDHWGPVLLLFTFTLPILLILDGKFYSIWDVNIPPINPALQIQKFSSIWDPSAIGGRNYNLSPYLPLLIETYLASLILPLNVANSFVFYLHYFLSGFSMYCLFLYVFKGEDIVKIKIAGTIAAFMYMFNEYWFLRAHYNFNIVFALAYLPLLVIYLLEITHLKKKRAFFNNLLKAALLSVLMVPGLSNLPVAALILLILTLFFFFVGTIQKRPFISLMKRYLVLGLCIIPFHIWWTAPSLLNSSTQEALSKKGNYLKDSMESLHVLRNHDVTKYNRILTGKSYFIPPAGEKGSHVKYTEYAELQETIFIRLISFVPIFLAGLVFFGDFKRPQKAILLTLFLLLLFLVPILAFGRPPFGKVIEFFVLNFPLYVFRRPPTYMFFIHFIYALLAASFILVLLKSKTFGPLWKVGISLFLIGSVSIVNFPRIIGAPAYMTLHNESRDENLHISAAFKIPDYVQNLSDYINEQRGEFGVIVLPISAELRAYDWRNLEGGYFGYDPYAFLLKHPINSNFSYRHAVFSFNKYLHTSISTGDVKAFAAILRRFNIRYIILTRDIIRTPTLHKEFFSQNVGVENFLKTTSAKKVKTFGQHVLYEVEQTKEIFESVIDISYVHNIKIEDMYWFLKSDSNKNFLANSEPLPLDSFSVNNIDKISPTHYRVIVDTANLNNNVGLLKSSLFFDLGWKAEIDGVELKKLKVDQLFNGWIIAPKATDGKTTQSQLVKIVYGPQQMMNRVYVMTIVLLLGSLIFVFIPSSKKHSPHHQS